MIEEDIKNIYNEVYNIDRNGCDKLQRMSQNTNSGGQQREEHGSLNERILKHIINKIGELCGVKVNVKKGEKEDKIYYKNVGGKISVSLDWHVYVEKELKIVIEVKSYLDTTMLKRTLYEISKIKEIDPNIVSGIIQFEDGMGEDAITFAKNEKDLDFLLTVTDNKRTSKIKRFNKGEGGLIKYNEDFVMFLTTVYRALKAKEILNE
jgi:hypothetical protein